MSNYWGTTAAIALVVLVAALNVAGLRLGRTVQAAMTLLKVGLLLAFSIAALLAADSIQWFARGEDATPGTWMLLAIFAFGGWTQITFMAGELRNPRSLPKPLALGIAAVTVLYLVALLAMLSAMPATGPGNQLAITVAHELFGATGQTIVALMIAIAVLGGLHTFTMAGARLYQAAAQQGAWWHPFARANGRDAPARSLWFQALWASFLLALSMLSADAFTALIASISTGIWLWNGFLALAWFRARKHATAFATPGGPWTVMIFGLAAAAIVLAGLVQDFIHIINGAWNELGALWAIAIVAAGIPVARRMRHGDVVSRA